MSVRRLPLSMFFFPWEQDAAVARVGRRGQARRASRSRNSIESSAPSSTVTPGVSLPGMALVTSVAPLRMAGKASCARRTASTKRAPPRNHVVMVKSPSPARETDMCQSCLLRKKGLSQLNHHNMR